MVECPEVLTECKDVEERRAMLEDALREMVVTHKELGKEIPQGNALVSSSAAEV